MGKQAAHPGSLLNRLASMVAMFSAQVARGGEFAEKHAGPLRDAKVRYQRELNSIGNLGRGTTPQRLGASRTSHAERSARRRGARKAKARRRSTRLN